MEINLQQVQEFINANSENEEVKGFLSGFIKEPTLDVFKTKLDSDEEFKNYVNSLKDSHFSKSLETWKQNNLSKIVETEILKRNPKLTPEQLEVENLRKEVETIKHEKDKAEMLAKYKDVLSEKKIPPKMIDFLLSNDEESTNTNISLFEESMTAYINEAIKAKFDENVHIPQKSNDENINLITQEEWDRNKNDLDWYAKNKTKILESRRQGLIK